MPDSPTLTKADNGRDYNSPDGRWHAEKIDGGYRLWRVHGGANLSLVPEEFAKISDVRDYLEVHG